MILTKRQEEVSLLWIIINAVCLTAELTTLFILKNIRVESFNHIFAVASNILFIAGYVLIALNIIILISVLIIRNKRLKKRSENH